LGLHLKGAFVDTAIHYAIKGRPMLVTARLAQLGLTSMGCRVPQLATKSYLSHVR